MGRVGFRVTYGFQSIQHVKSPVDPTSGQLVGDQQGVDPALEPVQNVKNCF